MIERFKVQAHELRGSDHYELPGDVVLVRASDYAALEAELARVKAESLRVVVAKETCSLNECSERFYIQPTCRHDRQVTEKNIQADFRRHPDTTVLPVRLERWEVDAHANHD